MLSIDQVCAQCGEAFSTIDLRSCTKGDGIHRWVPKSNIQISTEAGAMLEVFETEWLEETADLDIDKFADEPAFGEAFRRALEKAYRMGYVHCTAHLTKAATAIAEHIAVSAAATDQRTQLLRAKGFCGAVKDGVACIEVLGHGPHAFDVRSRGALSPEPMPQTLNETLFTSVLKEDPVLAALVAVMQSAEAIEQWPDKEVVSREAMQAMRQAIWEAHQRQHAPGIDR